MSEQDRNHDANHGGGVDPKPSRKNTRRGFLKGAASLAAATAALSTASQQTAQASSLPPLAAQPGAPMPWQLSVGIGHGRLTA